MLHKFSNMTRRVQVAVTLPRITTVLYRDGETCSVAAVPVVSACMMWPERRYGPVRIQAVGRPWPISRRGRRRPLAP